MSRFEDDIRHERKKELSSFPEYREVLSIEVLDDLDDDIRIVPELQKVEIAERDFGDFRRDLFSYGNVLMRGALIEKAPLAI